MSDDATAWRSEFAIVDRCAYLDHAVMGPLPRRSVAAGTAVLDAQANTASLSFEAAVKAVEDVRAAYARLIGAPTDTIAILDSTSAALGLVATGLPWRGGDSVVAPEIDFPANLLPWANLATREVTLRRVPAIEGRVEAERLIAACDATTRVIAVSLVQFSNGYRVDIARLGEWCRARGVLLVVDAMQAAGTEPLDLAALPIDIFAAGARKWLLGPPGVAWLYVRRELLDRIAPTILGTRSIKPSASYILRDVDLREDARRFEGGVQNLAGIAAAGASLRLLSEVGTTRIAERIAALTGYLVGGLRSKGCTVLSPRARPDEGSAIVTFRHPRAESAAAHKALSDAGVVVSIREGALRASPHFYNTTDEIDRLLAALPR